MKITSNFPLQACPDCESEHIGSRCGMTMKERLKTVQLSSEWMPSKQRDREIGSDKGGKDWYDGEALKDVFMDDLSPDERKEELLEDTQGVGYAEPDEIAKYSDLAAAHYLDNPKDELADA